MVLTDFQKLSLYTRNFYTTKQLEKCLDHTSKISKKSKDYVITYLLKIISNVIESCAEQAERNGLKLKEVQHRLIDHMTKHRGAIAAFGVGVGKTLLGVVTADCLLRIGRLIGKDVQVIVVTPTSLQENFKKEMDRYGSGRKDPRYIFYTIDTFSRRLKENLIENIENSLVIIDEAHNLKKDYRLEFGESEIQIKSKKSDTTRAKVCLDCTEKAWKVLLLTATPMYNKPHDVVNLAAMARAENPPIDRSFYHSLCPHIDYTDMSAEKRAECDKKLEQYFGCILSFANAPVENYPDVITKIVPIMMTPEYLAAYKAKEMAVAAQADLKKKKKDEDSEKESNAFMVALRMASNNLSPCLKCEYVMNVIRSGRHVVTTEETKIKKGKSVTVKKNHTVYEKTLVFSEYLESGLDLVKSALDAEGIQYMSIVGNVSQAKRTEMVAKINSNDPDEPKILFLSKAGGEGLDLKGIRHIIIFESAWNESVSEQAIGRGRRFMSHSHLPKAHQNVTVHRLIIIKNKEEEELLKDLAVGGNLAKFKEASFRILHYKDLAKNKIRAMVQQLRETSDPNKRRELEVRIKIQSFEAPEERPSADLYLYALSLNKYAETVLFGQRLRKIDINNLMCDEFLYDSGM